MGSSPGKMPFFDASDNIDSLARSIDDYSSELRKSLEEFSTAMNNFAGERSLESCLDALNRSMQIANLRGKLVDSYKYYSQLLEQEITRLQRSNSRSDKEGGNYGNT